MFTQKGLEQGREVQRPRGHALAKAQVQGYPTKGERSAGEGHGNFVKQITDNFVPSTGVKLIIQGETRGQQESLVHKAPDRLNLTRSEFNRLKEAKLKEKEKSLVKNMVVDKNESMAPNTDLKKTKIEVQVHKQEKDEIRQLGRANNPNQEGRPPQMPSRQKMKPRNEDGPRQLEEMQGKAVVRDTRAGNPHLMVKYSKVGAVGSIPKIDKETRSKLNGIITVENKKSIGKLVDWMDETKNYQNNSTEMYAIAELNKDDVRLMGPTRNRDLQEKPNKEKDLTRARSGPAIDRKEIVEEKNHNKNAIQLQTTESGFNLNSKEMYSTNPALFRDLRATTKNFKKSTLGYRIKCPRQRSKLFGSD